MSRWFFIVLPLLVKVRKINSPGLLISIGNNYNKWLRLLRTTERKKEQNKRRLFVVTNDRL